MTIAAIHTLMIFAQVHTNQVRMIEAVGVAPTFGVATLTITRQLTMGMLLAVTGMASQISMEAFEHKTRVVVLEDTILFLGVAASTVAGPMAFFTGRSIREVVKFQANFRLRTQMATIAVVQDVTIVTADIVFVCMRSMVEGHVGSRFMIGQEIHDLTRFAVRSMFRNDVLTDRHAVAVQGQVADLAVGLAAPVLMTSHALAVIGDLQIDEILCPLDTFVRMAITAALNLMRHILMVAETTGVSTHTGHLGVSLVIEGNRFVEIYEPIEYDHVR